MMEKWIENLKPSSVYLVGLFCLVLPFLVLGAMTIGHTVDREYGQKWKIEITGYDPRDILQGHYLRFRYLWNWSDGGEHLCPQSKGDCCMCLNKQDDGDVNPFVSLHACESPVLNSCDAVWKGRAGFGNFTVPLNRYYISQTLALPAQSLILRPPNNETFHIEISLNKANKGMIRGMYVNETIPIEDYLVEQKNLKNSGQTSGQTIRVQGTNN